MVTAEAAAAALGVTRADALRLCQPRPGAGRPRSARSAAASLQCGRYRAARGRKVRGRKAAEIAAGALDWGQPALVLRHHADRGRPAVLSRARRGAARRTASLEDVARLLWECSDDPFHDARPTPRRAGCNADAGSRRRIPDRSLSRAAAAGRRRRDDDMAARTAPALARGRAAVARGRGRGDRNDARRRADPSSCRACLGDRTSAPRS